jgi:hypothetical protein
LCSKPEHNAAHNIIASTTRQALGIESIASDRTLFWNKKVHENRFFTMHGAIKFFKDEGLKSAVFSVLLSTPFGKEFSARPAVPHSALH